MTTACWTIRWAQDLCSQFVFPARLRRDRQGQFAPPPAPQPLPDARPNSVDPAGECPGRTGSPSRGGVYFPEWWRTTARWPVPPTAPSGETARAAKPDKVGKIRKGLTAFVDAPRVRPEQGRFQLAIVPAFRQRPADAYRLGPLQVLVNGAVPDRTRRGGRAICRCPSPNSKRTRRTSLSLRMDNLFVGPAEAGWVPPAFSGTQTASMLSSVLRPVEIVPN